MEMPQKRFTIALSFPGEHRTFVEQVASALSSQIGKIVCCTINTMKRNLPDQILIPTFSHSIMMTLD